MIESLQKAKTAIVLDHPFYATLLLSMPMIEDNNIETMGVDGENIFYNKEFVEKHTVPELTFVLAHEVMHCVFLHSLRRGTRSHNKYNQATDYIINDLLVSDKVGTMPTSGLYNPELVRQGGHTTEGVYAILPEENEKNGTGDKNGAMDDVLDNPDATDESSASEKEAEMKVKVLQATNIAKAHGKLSAGLKRLVDDVTKSKVDWKTVLRNFITARAKTDWSFAKPKRRFLGEEIYLPGLIGERMNDIVIAVDCSGSIDKKVLSDFSAEIKAIISDVAPAKTHVIYFDSQVLKHDTFNQDDEFAIDAVGGGGTAFSPVFNYCKENDIVPECCVFLTDLICDDFGDEPEYPVLWASTSAENAPFGTIVKVV